MIVKLKKWSKILEAILLKFNINLQNLQNHFIVRGDDQVSLSGTPFKLLIDSLAHKVPKTWNLIIFRIFEKKNFIKKLLKLESLIY